VIDWIDAHPLHVVIPAMLASVAFIAFMVWFALRGRRMQLEREHLPLERRLGDYSPYSVGEVAIALALWAEVVTDITGEREGLEDVIRLVRIDFRARRWKTALGFANGEMINPDATARGHAAPFIAVYAGYPDIYDTALGHELTHAWHLWTGVQLKVDPDREYLGVHADALLEAEIESTWRKRGKALAVEA
jgi:hypothetical protein